MAAGLLRYSGVIMKKYEIVGRYIELHEGFIHVTEAQARRRSASLHPLGGGMYRIDNPAQFKVGEIVGLDYDPPKPLAQFMKLVEELPEAGLVEELSATQEVEELPEIKPVFKHKK